MATTVVITAVCDPATEQVRVLVGSKQINTADVINQELVLVNGESSTVTLGTGEFVQVDEALI